MLICPWFRFVVAGPQEDTPGQIRQFEKMFLAPGFLAYGSTLIVASLVIVFFFAPRCVPGRPGFFIYAFALPV